MQPLSPVTTFDWEDILDALKDEKCILFLGPGAFRTAEGRTLESQLHEELDAFNTENPYIRTFYEDDGFFLFRDDRFKRKVIRRVRRFYEEPQPATEALLAKLARIPFHTPKPGDCSVVANAWCSSSTSLKSCSATRRHKCGNSRTRWPNCCAAARPSATNRCWK